MSEYKCSRCGTLIETNPNCIMTDKGVSWSLCDCCYKDLCSFISPDGYRYRHQKSEEVVSEHEASVRLFNRIAEIKSKYGGRR